MPIKLRTSLGTEVTLVDKPIGSGGEGTVHKIISPPAYKDYCAKLYKSRGDQLRRKENKISYLISDLTSSVKLSRNDQIQVCSPVETLNSPDRAARFRGFLMPRAPDESLELEILCKNKSKLLNRSWSSKYDRTSSSGVRSRLKLCVNIAAALDLIHKKNKYVLVDLKPQNIRVTMDGRVSVLDLDSVQIVENNKVLFPARVVTFEYAPMEADKLNPSSNLIPENWDRFSLAVMFYELLFGLHPYSASFKGRYQSSTNLSDNIRNGLFVHGSKKTFVHKKGEPHDNFSFLPRSVQDLFLRALDTGHNNPNLRPSVREWGETIYREISRSNGLKGFTHQIQRKKPSSASLNKGPNWSQKSAQSPWTYTSATTPPTTNKTTVPITNSPTILLKVVGGIGGLLLLCMIGSGIVGFVGNLGQPQATSNSMTNTSRPGSSPITQPSSSYTSNLPSTFSRKYTGTINGGTDFILSLDKNGPRLEGKAETGKSWDKLSGTIDSDGSFEVEAYERGNKQKHTGNYRGTISDRSISNGTWSRPDGTGETSFDVSY